MPGYEYGHRNKSVDQSRFSMVPLSKVPRSVFKFPMAHKTTMNGSVLVPVFIEEVLPGDSWNVRATMFARMSTLLFPIMDNLHLDSFWFFVPNRLVWDNWVKFQGEQRNPSDSVDYLVPKINIDPNRVVSGGLANYLGIPGVKQLNTATGGLSINALPFRGYNLIYNEWFRDENLQNSLTVHTGDGPDTYDATAGTGENRMQVRGKRHDYFTSALPWPLKGGVDVRLPLGSIAPVLGIGAPVNGTQVIAGPLNVRQTGNVIDNFPNGFLLSDAGTPASQAVIRAHNLDATNAVPDIYADLSAATSATINSIRQAFTIQQYLESNARGGTRYTEILRARFGVASPDARLQRPEYLGGNSTPIHVTPLAQTAPTSGGSGPLASLGGIANVVHQTGFSSAFVEHGYLMCLVNVRADITYQQGIARHWYRNTVYDYYAPEFAHLGEQVVYMREIFARGDSQDEQAFGYQARWEEYRQLPSRISGEFQDGINSAGTLDPWHLAQRFTAAPTLGPNFIIDPTAGTVNRVTAIDDVANPNQQFLFDSRYDITMVRPLPTYSVPGLTRF